VPYAFDITNPLIRVLEHELRQSVAAPARAFFRRCCDLQLVSPELLAGADQLRNLDYDDFVPTQTV
jgi:hypothetical protein